MLFRSQDHVEQADCACELAASQTLIRIAGRHSRRTFGELGVEDLEDDQRVWRCAQGGSARRAPVGQPGSSPAPPRRILQTHIQSSPALPTPAPPSAHPTAPCPANEGRTSAHVSPIERALPRSQLDELLHVVLRERLAAVPCRLVSISTRGAEGARRPHHDIAEAALESGRSTSSGRTSERPPSRRV